jgi:hypothetical protein
MDYHYKLDFHGLSITVSARSEKCVVCGELKNYTLALNQNFVCDSCIDSLSAFMHILGRKQMSKIVDTAKENYNDRNIESGPQ